MGMPSAMNPNSGLCAPAVFVYTQPDAGSVLGFRVQVFRL